MNDQETPKTVAETIEARYRELEFTKTPGNSHYASRDEEDLARRNASVELFLASDDLEEPDIFPTRYEQTVIDKTIEEYESMLDVLMAEPHRTREDDILIDKIINKTGELFRYEELQLAMGAVACGDRQRHVRIASDLSLEIMGGMNEPAFSRLLGELTSLADSSQSHYGSELLALIKPERAEVSESSIELEDTTREVISYDLKNMYPGLAELLNEPETGSLSPEEAIPIFKQLQDIADLSDEWQVKLDNSKAAQTSGTEKVVYIGRNRARFKDRRTAIAVGFHESVVHGGRSEGISLPDSLDFEEGLATRLQQIITGEHRTPGVQYYLAIGLQAGADRGGEPRNYRETFEILWRREALLMEQSGKEVDIDKARALAQRHIQRTRRGGAIDTRDAAYFIGAQKAATWLNDIAKLPTVERRQQLALVLTHRYDPTNPDHVAYIKHNT